MDRFKGKVAVVTGSSAGIGREIVKELVKRELIVVGLARNMKSQQELVTEISTNPETYTGRFHPLQCDVSKEKQIRDSFAYIKEKIGNIAILVNNAGFLGTYAELMDVTVEELHKIFDLNVHGALLCAREALRSMCEQSLVGHIVNINSTSGLPDYKDDEFFPYCASKHAIRVLLKALRHEIVKKKLDVKISNLSPGLVDTAMIQNFYTKDTEKLQAADIASACISILDTPPNVLIEELTIIPRLTASQ